MADKKTVELSFVLRAVDKATAKLKAITDRIEGVTKPFRDFKEQLGELREKSGFDDVISGFGGVGDAVMGIVGKVALVGGAIAAATAGVLSLIDGFDDIGDKAEALGVSVDFLAQMRYAAERSGASIEAIDGGLATFTKNLGLARAGGGLMTKFLGTVSPVLLKQLKATKTSAEAFDLLAGAMEKIQDPAKRAAFAQKTLGDASLGVLFNKGRKGIKELRDEYFASAGSMEEAAAAAGATDDELKKLKASTDGIKAALVSGLAPALTIIIERLRTWFTEHREDVKEWAAQLGKKLPDAFAKLQGALGKIRDFVEPFVDSSTKLKIVVGAVAAVIAGPLISALVSLGIALLTTPVGWIVAGIAGIAAASYALINAWEALPQPFHDVWEAITGGFTWAKTLIKAALAPIIGFPVFIITSWEAIGDFFSALWGGVVGAFEGAWDIIKAICDKIVAAVETVVDAIDTVTNLAVAEHGIGSWEGKAREVAIQASQVPQTFQSGAKVVVDFSNLPRGAKVSAPQGDADVTTNVGYQMGAIP